MQRSPVNLLTPTVLDAGPILGQTKRSEPTNARRAVIRTRDGFFNSTLPALAATAAITAAVMAPVSVRAEIRNLYRSTRAMAMGGAFTAIADKEEALFVNPAALAGNEELYMSPLVGDAEGSADIYSNFDTLMGVASNFTISSLNDLTGKNIYGRAQLTPTLLMPNFAVAIMIDGQAAFFNQNQALPYATLGYQNTNGIQFGYALSLASTRRLKRRTHDVRVGVAGKVMWRRGGYYQLAMSELLNFATNQTTFLGGLVGNYSLGYGVDLGLQYLQLVNKDVSIATGLVYTEIGDMAFGGNAETQKGNMSGGVGITYHPHRQSYQIKLAYDYQNALLPVDWRLKNHLGVELKLPFISLYSGLNQAYLTYGATVDLWMFQVTAASYAHELGEYLHQDPNRRYSVRAVFKLLL